MLTTQSPIFTAFSDYSYFRVHDPLGIIQPKDDKWNFEEGQEYSSGSTNQGKDSDEINHDYSSHSTTNGLEFEEPMEKSFLHYSEVVPERKLDFNDDTLFRKSSIDFNDENEAEGNNTLLELVFEYEYGFETLPINDLRNLEVSLESICMKNNISEREAICFKICILRKIKEEYPANQIIDELLNDLMTINFNMIMNEVSENY